jgi:hypothetical protein
VVGTVIKGTILVVPFSLPSQAVGHAGQRSAHAAKLGYEWVESGLQSRASFALKTPIAIERPTSARRFLAILEKLL